MRSSYTHRTTVVIATSSDARVPRRYGTNFFTVMPPVPFWYAT
jgi:hypothetical protein